MLEHAATPAHDPTLIGAAEWRQIVNGATETAIISTDREGRVTSWNSGAVRILGWSEAEMLGQTLERIFTPEDRARSVLGHEMRDAASGVRRDGGEQGWRLRKDGSRFWAVGEVTPILKGELVLGFIKIVRDRTRQRDAEQQVRAEREALAVTNRAMSALAIEPDQARLVQIVTDAALALCNAEFGAFFYNQTNDKGERYLLYALSGAPLEAFAGFSLPRITAVFAPTFAGQGIVRSDDITADARYGHNAPHRGMPPGHLPVRSYMAVPVVSRTGSVIGALFLGHAAPGVFDEQSELRVIGLAAEAAVAIDNARLTQQLRDLNATLERQVSERTAQLRLNEEALRQSQKMDALGQLTGGVAHDFNNLLQVILGNLDTARRALPMELERPLLALHNAAAGARRAAALTQRLLAFSRRQPLNPTPVDVDALVSGMTDLLRRTLGEIVQLKTLRTAGLWRTEVDANELESAILNLALNARDAMAGGGQLTIETGNAHISGASHTAQLDMAEGDYVCISVSDTGTGMDEATCARAFEPFFTTKAVGKGTGLGLSQVYGFVKQSGGHVRIDSEPGRGTTLRLHLPRLTGEAAEPAKPQEDTPTVGAAGETILVTEDDDAVRDNVVQMLRELGYRVMEARDGPAALQQLSAHAAIDLLFTDVVLPGGMTGAQLAAQARAAYPRLQILFTTGYARDAIVHHGRLDRGVQLIAKPYSFEDLAARVRAVLDDRARHSGHT